jgi:hypothetical protein
MKRARVSAGIGLLILSVIVALASLRAEEANTNLDLKENMRRRAEVIQEVGKLLALGDIKGAADAMKSLPALPRDFQGEQFADAVARFNNRLSEFRSILSGNDPEAALDSFTNFLKQCLGCHTEQDIRTRLVR